MKRSDSGSIMILMIFFAVIVAGLITVVVDVSTVFLGNRDLQSLADGAVAAAAQNADVNVLYGGTGDNGIGPGGVLPLTADGVKAALETYVEAQKSQPHECVAGTLQIAETEVTDQTVDVTLTCKVSLPFVRLVESSEQAGHRISVSAQARLLVRPPAPPAASPSAAPSSP